MIDAANAAQPLPQLPTRSQRPQISTPSTRPIRRARVSRTSFSQIEGASVAQRIQGELEVRKLVDT